MKLYLVWYKDSNMVRKECETIYIVKTNSKANAIKCIKDEWNKIYECPENPYKNNEFDAMELSDALNDMTDNSFVGIRSVTYERNGSKTI